MRSISYTRDHQWIRCEPDDTLTVGITAFACEQLGAILSVELPAVGARIERGEEAMLLETAKSIVGVAMPCSGVIVAVNAPLAEDAARLSADPQRAGWLFRLQPEGAAAPSEWLDEAAYLQWIGGTTGRPQP